MDEQYLEFKVKMDTLSRLRKEASERCDERLAYLESQGIVRRKRPWFRSLAKLMEIQEDLEKECCYVDRRFAEAHHLVRDCGHQRDLLAHQHPTFHDKYRKETLEKLLEVVHPLKH